MIKSWSFRRLFFFILLFFTAYCLFLSWSFLFQNVDDAYISFRYGKNLMLGHGLVYNPGEYVEGYTNFLWTVITAPFTVSKIIDVSVFATVFCLLISLLNISFLAKLSRLFVQDFELFKAILILVPSVFLALDNSIAFWGIGGMEFPMYTFFILGMVYSYFKINDHPKHIYLIILNLILCTLTRPEGNMIFAIFIIHFILYRKYINDFKKHFVKIILFYSLFCLLYYGFKYFYYGQIIPNTFYAKGVTDLRMNIVLGTKYLALCIGTRLYLFIFIAFIPFKQSFKRFKESFLLIFVIVYIIYIVAVGGDWMIANRFFVPILPLLYILSIIGFIHFLIKLQNINKSLEKTLSLGRKMLVGLCILLFAVTLSLLEYKQLIIKDDNAKYEEHWSMFGKWLKMNVPPETIIAVGPAGKIPYYSELYTIDMWGLNNAYIAKTESKRLHAGHKKFDFDYVLSLKPEFMIGYAGFTDKDVPSRYVKFNAPEDDYKCYDVVFRLKDEFRKK
jgi:arabinofuranosyltransferase